MTSQSAMQLNDSDDLRGDLRAGTLGAALLGGALIVGLLAHGQLLLALVGLLTLLVTIPVIRMVYAGVIHPLTSTAASIVARAAGEEPYAPTRRDWPSQASQPARSEPAAKPAYTIVVRCGCGAAIEVNASISTDIQRAMLELFFTVHESCMARALAHDPGVSPMTSTITCACGRQLTVDVANTERDEMARQSEAFITAHRGCAERTSH
ncbi:MAG: hypothetical protein ACRDUX_15210 [Mycobacterium sp.]